MIALMAYAILVSGLLGFAAVYSERILAEFGRARRGIWMIALGVSAILPVYGFFRPIAVEDHASRSGPLLFDFVPVVVQAEIKNAMTDAIAESWLTVPDWQSFDSVLLSFWILTSVVTLLCYCIAAMTLNQSVRRAKTVTVDGLTVIVSDRIGPAVVGFFKPKIILSPWIARADANLRALVVSHEREHIVARDQLTLLGALLLVACMPWNPVVWWQLKRLRAAIEVDCDARVLKSGADRVSYSEALLWVRQRSGGLPFGAIALTEPVSDLERRIRIMLDKARKFSASRTGLRSAIAMSLVAIALSVEAPLAQQANDGALPPAQAGKAIPTIRTAVYDLLSQAQLCMDREDFVCAGAYLDQALQMDLNGYEKAQYWNFTAFIAFEQNDSNGAITAFENVLADPAAIPDGMRDTAIRSLGALYASTEQYEKAFNRLNELLELNGISLAFKVGFGVPDGEYLPIVKVAPTYPKRAAAEGLDGYVIVQYTVTKSGATSEVVIIESSNTVFEQAAVESARKYKYKPRVVDGQPVAVPGVTTKMIFEANPAQSVSIEP